MCLHLEYSSRVVQIVRPPTLRVAGWLMNNNVYSFFFINQSCIDRSLLLRGGKSGLFSSHFVGSKFKRPIDNDVDIVRLTVEGNF